MMEENKNRQRRKGRPMKRRELPFNKEIRNISLTLGVGLIVLFVLYSFFSKGREMIRFSYDSAAHTAAAAALVFGEREETGILFSKLAECSEGNARITEELSEDEKTVVMSAFSDIPGMSEYRMLKERIREFKEIWPGCERVALGLYDKDSGLLMIGVDEKEEPGTVIKPERWNDPDMVGHMVHMTIPGGEGQLSREAVVWFDSDHMYKREYGSLIVTTLIALIFAAVCCINASIKTRAYMKKQEFAKYKFYGAEIADMKPELNLYPGINNPRELYVRLMKIWCEYTCTPRLRDKWSEDNRTVGQCSITAFLVQDIFGGEVRGIEREGGNFHCYNVVNGKVFDLTSEQFGDEELIYSDDDPIQSREEHFAREEKKQRYEYLRDKLETRKE